MSFHKFSIANYLATAIAGLELSRRKQAVCV